MRPTATTPMAPTVTATAPTSLSDPSPLARCVGDVDAFVETAWSGAPWVHRAGAGRFDDLLTVGDVDDLIAGAGLRLPFARMVRDGRALDSSEYTYRAGVGSRPVDDLIDPA